MKAALVVVLLLGVLSLSYAQSLLCPKTTCVKGGEICNNNSTSLVQCRGDSYCSASGFGKGICLIPARLGEPCGDLGCEAGTDCLGGICVALRPGIRYLYPGEGCSDDLQCKYNSPYPDDDDADRCRSKKCRRIDVGDYCSIPATSSDSSRQQCDYTKSYCSKNYICEKYIKKGGPCNYQDASEYGCGRGRTCMPNSETDQTGTCKDTYSQKEGEFCRDITDCDEGLFCYRAPLTARGICRKPTTTATRDLPCISDLTCTADNSEVCDCNGGDTPVCKVNVYPKGWRDTEKNFYECSRKKGCDDIDDSYNCIKDECKSQRCKHYKKSKDGNKNYLDCGLEGLCNSGFAVVASPILAIAMLAIAFVF